MWFWTLLNCCGVNEGAMGRGRVPRVTHAHAADLVHEEGEDVLDLALVHQEPAGGVAGLAVVGEPALDVPAGGLLQVAVGQDDVRRLAAQLQADALDGLSRRLAHPDVPHRSIR